MAWVLCGKVWWMGLGGDTGLWCWVDAQLGPSCVCREPMRTQMLPACISRVCSSDASFTDSSGSKTHGRSLSVSQSLSCFGAFMTTESPPASWLCAPVSSAVIASLASLRLCLLHSFLWSCRLCAQGHRTTLGSLSRG